MSTKTQEYRHPDTKAVPTSDVKPKWTAPRKSHKPRGHEHRRIYCHSSYFYWEVTPGQLTHKSLFGSGSQSYNAQGMGLEKHRDDLFRHWLLGFGSGDLRIRTSGATHEQIDLINVLFIGSKVKVMQRLIAEVPEEPEST